MTRHQRWSCLWYCFQGVLQAEFDAVRESDRTLTEPESQEVTQWRNAQIPRSFCLNYMELVITVWTLSNKNANDTSENHQEPVLRLCKSLALTICWHEDVSKFFTRKDVFCWNSDFHPAGANIGKAYSVIRNSDCTLMIELDRDLYFLAIYFPVSLTSHPAYYP